MRRSSSLICSLVRCQGIADGGGGGTPAAAGGGGGGTPAAAGGGGGGTSAAGGGGTPGGRGGHISGKIPSLRACFRWVLSLVPQDVWLGPRKRHMMLSHATLESARE